jgi:uncharacterized membrane protein
VTPSFELWFAVRYAHIVSVMLLAGGAAMLCACCVFLTRTGDSGIVVRAASGFAA